MPFADDALEILGEIAENKANLELMEGHLHNVVPFVGDEFSRNFGYPTWTQFLSKAAREFNLGATIDPYLEGLEFEQAAQIIINHASDADQFDNFVHGCFDAQKIATVLRHGPAYQLARFAQGLVLTSNFDHVLEKAFQDAGRPFRQIVAGAKALGVPSAFQLGQNLLIKMRGDYNDKKSWIITHDHYTKAYGDEAPKNIQLSRLLPSILAHVLKSCSLLFLGCSLEDDYTTRTVANIARTVQDRTVEGTPHFALLPRMADDIESEHFKRRIKELDDWNIRPLFVSGNHFEKIEQFLICLTNEVRQIPVQAPKAEFPESKPRTTARLPEILGRDGDLVHVDNMNLNVELLEAQEQLCYRMLVVFPGETAIPCAAAAELWDIGLKDAEKVLQKFHNLALANLADDNTFSLRKAFCAWLRQEATREATLRDQMARWGQEGFREPDSTETPKELQARLLNHWLNRWRDPYNLPHSYAWQWAVWHSREAGRSEVKELLLDLRWIEAKLEHMGLESLIADCDLVQPSEPHRLLRRALMQSAQVIVGDRAQLSAQLLARLIDVKEESAIEELKAQLHGRLSAKPGGIIPSWPSLTQANNALLWTFKGDDHGVSAIALGDDEDILACGYADGAIKIWNLVTGNEICTIPGHEEPVLSVALSSDGNTLASSSENAIKVWNLTRKEEVFARKEPPCATRSVTLSADGRILAFASSENTIAMWDLLTGKVKPLEINFNGPHSWKVTPDGSTLVFGSADNTLRVRHLGTGQEMCRPQDQSNLKYIALSGDGIKLASGSLDNIVSISPVQARGSLINLIGRARDITSLALDMNGTTLASGSSDGTLTIWKPQESGRDEPIFHKEVHRAKVTSVILSRNGRTLVSASLDKTVKVWDLSTGTREEEPSGHSQVMSVALNREARKLVSGCSKGIRVWDLKTRNLTHESEQDGRVISWMANPKGRSGHSLASAGGKIITIWEPVSKNTTGAKNTTLSLVGHTDEVTAVILNEDGNVFVSGSRDRTIIIWDLGTGRPKRTLEGHSGEVTALALNKDGSILASGSADTTIKIWDASNGQELHTLPDHDGAVNSLALSGDGCILVSGSSDKTIRVWNPRTGERMRILRAHKACVRSIALSGDGYTLVSGSMDKTIKIWDLGKYDCQSAFFAGAAINCVALSSGNELGAGDDDGRIHVFDILPCQSNP